MKSEGPRALCGRCKGVPNPSITLLTAGRMHNPAMCGMRACTALGTTRARPAAAGLTAGYVVRAISCQ